ncbi:ankyrin repeat domain-containing protein [Mucilaginibacter sp. dw_454]|uniref:ankyrin repeat domain-containing protein n=1 Tax=Mucilaginibacter sp. dw_454 TaxID=2720079 RepID=UPI001BD435B9|nr:ankyrin repeat domain-containing protein [Mucilaginibacter sp. dw_454]
MKIQKLFLMFLLTAFSRLAFAQDVPADVFKAIKSDDAATLAKLVTKDNINNCYLEGSWSYTLLSITIRSSAKKCFDLLIEKGADVNHACEGYVPPLMHAAKYGSLDMVKTLVAKGADVSYTYHGDYSFADGKNPITYAEDNKQPAIAEYLRSVKPKQ